MLTALLLAAAPQDLLVLGPDAHTALHDALLAESRALHTANDHARAAAARSEPTMRARQAALRASFDSLLGPLPERTPLHTQVVGWLQADGYRVARLHFQSRPDHHVTANLYVPDGEGPFPGIAVPCGHSANGKAYDSYQRACALFATHGMVALIYDPIGQGERHQIELDRHGTTEHALLNTAGMLVGESVGKFELWDGSRAIDVLLERPELGGARSVGLAGNSGGGTQTVFLAAWEPRVAAATPACYVMQQQRLFETIGSQDGCQWLPGEGVVGLDHPDYLSLFAPRPMRVLAAQQDFFEFASTQAAVEQAGEVWRALAGPPLELRSTDQPHGWSVELREASAQWMRRWLRGVDGDLVEPQLDVFTDAELQVTDGGQVMGSFEGERSVRDMLVERAAALREAREARGPLEREALVAVVGVPPYELRCEVLRETAFEERTLRLGLATGGPLTLPYVELEGDGGTTLFLHERGKLAEPELLLEAARRGRRVVAIDLSGYGELADRGAAPKYHNSEYRVAMLALHTGRPLLGRRVGEALAWLEALELTEGDVELVGVGGAGVVALHAAYLDRRVTRVELVATIHSWERDVVGDPARPEQFGNVVPRALVHYDLPDLEAALGERVVRTAR